MFYATDDFGGRRRSHGRLVSARFTKRHLPPAKKNSLNDYLEREAPADVHSYQFSSFSNGEEPQCRAHGNRPTAPTPPTTSKPTASRAERWAARQHSPTPGAGRQPSKHPTPTNSQISNSIGYPSRRDGPEDDLDCNFHGWSGHTGHWITRNIP